MTRKRWIYDPETKEMVSLTEPTERPTSSGVFIWNEHQPYQSMATGEMVEGRAAHREHLKRNHLVEVGDAYDKPQTPRPMNAAPGLREAIARAVYQKLGS